MSFQSVCNLLVFEKSIEVVKFDNTSVHAFFTILGEKLMYNKIDIILKALFTLIAMVHVTP